jgi:biotin transport system substrate-specific component
MSTATLAFGRPTLSDRLLSRGILTDILFIVAGAGLTAALAQIAIPLWPVPITGQTLAVLVVGSSLGALRGALSMVLYAVVGALGAPIFSDHSAGISVIQGFSGGYIIGFIFSAALIGWIAQTNWDHRVWRAIVSALVGTLVTFVIGITWLWASLGRAGYPNDLNTVLSGGLYPFIVGGIVKAVIAGLVIGGSWWLVDRHDRRSRGDRLQDAS